jgi:hypothetical protein
MVLERTENEIIIRLPSVTDWSDLEAILKFIRFREIVSKSQATQEQIDQVVSAMNIVVDSNVVVSAILNRKSKIGEILIFGRQEFDFFAPKLMKLEIGNNKARLVEISQLSGWFKATSRDFRAHQHYS